MPVWRIPTSSWARACAGVTEKNGGTFVNVVGLGTPCHESLQYRTRKVLQLTEILRKIVILINIQYTELHYRQSCCGWWVVFTKNRLLFSRKGVAYNFTKPAHQRYATQSHNPSVERCTGLFLLLVGAWSHSLINTSRSSLLQILILLECLS